MRPQSVFEVVFEACRTFAVAVEINSSGAPRPADKLLQLAIDMGLFSIDTDAHAPGQLEFLYGCERAESLGLDPDRVINTWPLDQLLDWCAKTWSLIARRVNLCVDDATVAAEVVREAGTLAADVGERPGDQVQVVGLRCGLGR